MEINEIGEFGLIDRLTKGLPTHNASTLMGPGDDCAVIDSGDKLTLITSQLFMEGVQFDLTYIDMEHLAYKAVMATISNVFAMNGTPRQLTVSIGLGKRFKVEDLDAFYQGLQKACDKWGVDIVGGDTTSSFTGLAIALTCVGEVAKEEVVWDCRSWSARSLSIISRWTNTTRRCVRQRPKAIRRRFRLCKTIVRP